LNFYQPTYILVKLIQKGPYFFVTDSTNHLNVYKNNGTTYTFLTNTTIVMNGNWSRCSQWEFSLDGTVLAVSNMASSMTIYKWNGTNFAQITTVSGAVSCPTLSLDGTFLVSGPYNGGTYQPTNIYKWNTNQYTLFQSIDLSNSICNPKITGGNPANFWHLVCVHIFDANNNFYPQGITDYSNYNPVLAYMYTGSSFVQVNHGSSTLSFVKGGVTFDGTYLSFQTTYYS
jgi:hypothetical protein